MRIELKVPAIGESITEVEIGDWLKNPGDAVKADEPLVTLESEKATVELPAPSAGTMSEVTRHKGDVAKIGEIIGYMDDAVTAPQPKEKETKPATPKKTESKSEKPEPAKVERSKAEAEKPQAADSESRESENKKQEPGVENLRRESRSNPASSKSVQPGEPPAATTAKVQRLESNGQEAEGKAPREKVAAKQSERAEDVVPMSRLRRTVAERLVESQNSAALLTTFNEIDMGAVQSLRKEYGEAFQKKYNSKLGFMSFFVKACIEGLKQFPVLNARVQDTDVIYHNYYDIGVAVGGGKGLVVPVLRSAERMSFAEIELAIADFGRRASSNQLKVEELQGGTFTISNGGVYGSLLSTPIVNPPQSGVLGMHAIQERPVARDGLVVIRPMMYVALTYDHRIVDGREGVGFLKRVKEVIEQPARMLMEV